MIVFGGMVALLLIFRPRSVLDEAMVDRIRRWCRGLHYVQTGIPERQAKT